MAEDSIEVQELKERFRKENLADRPILTSFLAALRAGTFGGSDQALTGLGVKPEFLRGLSEGSPIADIAGELTGVLAPIPGTAPRLAAKVGQRLATKVFSNPVARTALAGATEGALFGAGQAISASALDEPTSAAELMISGAGFGGVANGIIGAIGQSFKKLSPLMKRAKGELFVRSLGGGKAQHRKIIDKRGLDALPDLGNELAKLKKQGLLKFTTNHDEMLKQIENELLPNAGKKIGDIKIKVSGLKGIEETTLDPRVISRRLFEEISPDMRGTGIAGADKILKPIEKLIKRYKKMNAPGGLTFAELETDKRVLQTIAFAKRGKSSSEEYKKAARILKQEGENSLQRIEDVLTTGSDDLALLADFKEAKRMYEVLSDTSTLLRESTLRSATNNSLSLRGSIIGSGFAAGAFSNAETVAKGGLSAVAAFGASALAKKIISEHGELIAAKSLDRVSSFGKVLNFASNSQRRIKRGIKVFLESAPKVSAVAGTSIIESNTPKKIKTPKEVKYEFEKIKQSIEEIKSSPEAYAERIEKSVPDIEGAPEAIKQEMANTFVRSIDFLAAKLPKDRLEGQHIDGAKKFQPSTVELKDYITLVKTVSDPLRILERLDTTTSNEIEAVQTVFPKLYIQIRDEMVKQLSENTDIPYAKRLHISKLLGIQGDPSMKQIGLLQSFSAGQGAGAEIQVPGKQIGDVFSTNIQTDFSRVGV